MPDYKKIIVLLVLIFNGFLYGQEIERKISALTKEINKLDQGINELDAYQTKLKGEIALTNQEFEQLQASYNDTITQYRINTNVQSKLILASFINWRKQESAKVDSLIELNRKLYLENKFNEYLKLQILALNAEKQVITEQKAQSAIVQSKANVLDKKLLAALEDLKKRKISLESQVNSLKKLDSALN